MTAPAGLIGVRLGFFYVAVFLVIGIILPFWPLWLAARGLDAGVIGILLALPNWVRILGTPAAATIADRLGETRRPVIVLSVAALLAWGLFLGAEGFWPIFLVTILASATMGPLMPLADGLTLRLAAMRLVDYGRVRLWGSLAFILASSLGGWWLAGRSPDTVLDLILIGLGLSVVAAFCLPDRRQPGHEPALADMLRLLADRRFMLLLLVIGLVQASHAVLYGFGTLHWLAAGHDASTIGVLWTIGVVAEIVLFAYGGRVLSRMDPHLLLIVGGAAAVLRWVVAGITTDLAALALIQTMHGLSFGATHLAAMALLARSAPSGLGATAQALHAAIAWGIVFGLVMLASGALYGRLAGAAFFPMAGLALVGVAGAVILRRLRPSGAMT